MAVLPLFAAWGMLTEQYSHQAEFAFVEKTAPSVVHPGTQLYLLSQEEFGVAEGAAILGLAAASGPVAPPQGRCEDPRPDASYRGPSIALLDRLVASCPERVTIDNGILFLGVSRPDDQLAPIQARYSLEPVVERTEMVSPDLGKNEPQPGLFTPTPGMSQRAVFGWYRLRSKQPAATL